MKFNDSGMITIKHSCPYNIINGTLNEISLNSRAFRVESSSGIGSNFKLLAFDCTGILPWDKALSHVVHSHCLPNVVMFSTEDLV